MTPDNDLRRWEIPGVAQFKEGSGGLVFLHIQTSLATAHIFLQGAHVTHFQPANERPVLFMSEASYYAPGKPIRGGVPVIFPWFGPREGFSDAPPHGFVRLLPWQVERLAQTDSGEVTIVLRLDSDEETRAQWPHDFVLRHTIVVGKALGMTFSVENRSPEPFRFEEALHTYLAVEDVRDVSITGLTGAEYLDKVDSFRRKTQDAEPIRITAETDRVYLDTDTTCIAEDPKVKRRLRVDKAGSATTVVWNPWIAKAAALPDFGDDEWPGMLCIETANAAENSVTLAPGATHEMRAVISVESV